nr:hypothetical protein [Rhizobium sp. AC44/96]
MMKVASGADLITNPLGADGSVIERMEVDIRSVQHGARRIWRLAQSRHAPKDDEIILMNDSACLDEQLADYASIHGDTPMLILKTGCFYATPWLPLYLRA